MPVQYNPLFPEDIDWGAVAANMPPPTFNASSGAGGMTNTGGWAPIESRIDPYRPQVTIPEPKDDTDAGMQGPAGAAGAAGPGGDQGKKPAKPLINLPRHAPGPVQVARGQQAARFAGGQNPDWVERGIAAGLFPEGYNLSFDTFEKNKKAEERLGRPGFYTGNPKYGASRAYRR